MLRIGAILCLFVCISCANDPIVAKKNTYAAFKKLGADSDSTTLVPTADECREIAAKLENGKCVCMAGFEMQDGACEEIQAIPENTPSFPATVSSSANAQPLAEPTPSVATTASKTECETNGGEWSATVNRCLCPLLPKPENSNLLQVICKAFTGQIGTKPPIKPK